MFRDAVDHSPDQTVFLGFPVQQEPYELIWFLLQESGTAFFIGDGERLVSIDLQVSGIERSRADVPWAERIHAAGRDALLGRVFANSS